MSETAAALMKADKKLHTLTLTRAALYLLEGVLQDPSPCETMAKTQQWNKAWAKVRKANDRTLTLSSGEVDLEKAVIRKEGETDIAWTNRRTEWEAASKAWQDLPVTLVITDKVRDTCRSALQWVYEHRSDGKSKTQLDNSNHATLLLVQLGLIEPIVDEDE